MIWYVRWTKNGSNFLRSNKSLISFQADTISQTSSTIWTVGIATSIIRYHSKLRLWLSFQSKIHGTVFVINRIIKRYAPSVHEVVTKKIFQLMSWALSVCSYQLLFEQMHWTFRSFSNIFFVPKYPSNIEKAILLYHWGFLSVMHVFLAFFEILSIFECRDFYRLDQAKFQSRTT